MSGSPSSQVLILPLSHFPWGEHVGVLRRSMPMSLLLVDFKPEPCLLLFAALHAPHLALINLSQLLSVMSSCCVTAPHAQLLLQLGLTSSNSCLG